ncbi:12981_t:CDS:1, partial [Dentiscutata heterogama]
QALAIKFSGSSFAESGFARSSLLANFCLGQVLLVGQVSLKPFIIARVRFLESSFFELSFSKSSFSGSGFSSPRPRFI